MTIIFATQEIQEKAKKYGFTSNLQEYVAKCRELPFKEAFSLFKIRHPYLYDRISNFRLIAKVEVVKDTEIICLLDLLKKGDKDAEDFNADHFRFGQDKLERLLDHSALHKYVEAEIEKGLKSESTKKKQMSDDMFHWLETFEHAPNSDELILESHRWTTKFQSKEYEKHWASYYEIVRNIPYVSVDRPIQENSRIFISDSDKGGRSVLYTRFLLEENHIGSESVIFLLDPRKPEEKLNPSTLLKDFDWICERDEIIKNMDIIAPFASRSYLSLVLADEDLWYQTETNDAANPALSAEELALLARVRHAPLDNAVLPIFINGRAGSGKSTMLYHLFSDYLHRKASLRLQGEILFLTYSDSLLKTAKENVRKLVQARTDLSMSSANIKLEDSLPEYEDCFQPFLGFIQRHIPNEVLIKHFRAEKYADFRVFKKVFGKYAPTNRLSADLCWHVIRTFIKGYTIDGYLSPEEYDDLPQKEKSVSQDVYNQVYKTVWDKYRESGYWDAQDLVRMVIKQGWTYPKYSVVFCDESQDFTRLELEFILKLLVYQEYDLGWTKYIRLPFALAGDPFQTLNPTGFRWEAIKASFYDEVVGNLDPYGRGNIEFDYKELSYNYRSQAPIVRLSNLFQLWREILFDTADVYPQKPWRNDEYIIPPRLYVLNENISEDAFFHVAANSVVILPCEQGQEKELVENDPLLLRLSQQNNYPIFQSPMTAKGLEYPRVILYGFGDACPDRFFTSQAGEVNLENEYFLNKLYVAATRAMKSLIIVDTKTGKEKLWKNTLGQDVIRSYIEKSKNPKKWSIDLVNGVTSGDYYEPQIEQVTQDPLEIARKLEEAGQNEPELLRQAMDFYHRAGEEGKARHCKAKALEADGSYKQAGDEFAAQGRPEDAERCYWKGEYWKELNIWYVEHEGGSTVHRETALFMVGDRKDIKSVALYTDFLASFLRDEKLMPVEQIQFQKAVQKVVDSLLGFNTELVDELRTFANVLKAIPSVQHIIDLGKCAEIMFLAEEYHVAVSMWDKLGQRETLQYQRAKSKITTDKKEKIYWLNKSKDYSEIILLYEASERVEFDKDGLRVIANAYRSSGKIKDALSLIWLIGDYLEALDIFNTLLIYLEGDEANNIFSEYYRTLLSNNQMDIAYDWYKVIEKQLTPEKRTEYGKMYAKKLLQASRWVDALQLTKSGKSKKSLRLAGESATEVTKLVITEIAMSEKLRDANVSDKNEITKYLFEIRSKGFQAWTAWLPLDVMSAALEKTSTLVEALEYYESLEREELYPEQKVFIHQRWLKVKSRQIDRLQGDINKASERDREKLSRSWNMRKKELDEKLSQWKMTITTISELPEYPLIKVDRDDDFARKLQVDWQSPACKIVFNEIQIMIDVKNGSLIAFPPDSIRQKSQNNTISFYSEKLPISGELVSGSCVKLYVSGNLSYEFTVN